MIKKLWYVYRKFPNKFYDTHYLAKYVLLHGNTVYVAKSITFAKK